MPWNKDIFLKNIRVLVDEYCGGSQKKFNQSLNYRDAVTKWKGKSSPSVDTLVSISDKYNCNLHWLLTGVGNKDIPVGVGGIVEPMDLAVDVFHQIAKEEGVEGLFSPEQERKIISLLRELLHDDIQKVADYQKAVGDKVRTIVKTVK